MIINLPKFGKTWTPNTQKSRFRFTEPKKIGMTTNKLIEALRKADPDGNAIVRIATPFDNKYCAAPVDVAAFLKPMDSLDEFIFRPKVIIIANSETDLPKSWEFEEDEK